MTTNDINAPWTLRLDRDGTEDIGVIYDADGDELLRSRCFWMPHGDDPIPPTLAALRLVIAAPRMLAALRLAQQALNTAVSFRVGNTSSYTIASMVDQAIAEAEGGRP